MHPSYEKLPAWLRKAYTESHINLALRTLAERESQRGVLRSMSVDYQRRQTSPRNSPNTSPKSSAKTHPEGHDHYSVIVANREENIHNNRYIDVVPYDRTRVVIKTGDVSQYLNASWVLERMGHKWWIATQAPLPTTMHTFLNLLLQPVSSPSKSLTSSSIEGTVTSGETSHIRTVVQLTKNVERNRTKAHAYFPNEVGKSLMIQPPGSGSPTPVLKITLLQSQNHADAQCIQSTLAITPVEDTRQLSINENAALEQDDKRVVFQHLLYTAWPDHGVPEEEDRTSLIAFLKLADQVNRDISLCSYPPAFPVAQYDPDPPMVVGCSAGIGRTGSFIALSSLLRHSGFLSLAANPTPASVIPPSPLGPLPEALAGDLVVEEIDFLREQRPRMVERPEQALLVYELLMDTLQRG